MAAAVSWAFSSAALTSVSVRVPALVVAALMALFASLVLIAALVVTGQYDDLTAASATTLLALVGSGIIGFVIGEPLYVRTLSILGMQRTYPVAMGLFILFATTGGIVLLGERFTPGLVVGGVLIVGGAYLIAAFRRGQSLHAGHAAPSGPGAGETRTAVAPAAVQARPRHLRAYGMLVLVPVMWTTATLVLARTGDEVGPIPAAALRVPAGAMLLTAFLLLARPRDLKAALRSRRDVLTIAGAGVTGISIASLLFVYALFEAGAARTSVLTASSPLFAMPLAVAFLGERVTRYVLLGTTLSVAGIIIVVTF